MHAWSKQVKRVSANKSQINANRAQIIRACSTHRRAAYASPQPAIKGSADTPASSVDTLTPPQADAPAPPPPSAAQPPAVGVPLAYACCSVSFPALPADLPYPWPPACRPAVPLAASRPRLQCDLPCSCPAVLPTYAATPTSLRDATDLQGRRLQEDEQEGDGPH